MSSPPPGSGYLPPFDTGSTACSGWAGAFSNLGMWALIFGRLWLMHDLTDSPLMLGVVTISSLGPVLLLSAWGGVVADRVNRLKLVTISRAMFSFLALLTGVLITTGVIQPWHVIAISLGTGILLSFDIPSRQAMLPNLVPREHLVNAIAIYSFLFAGSAIIGPGLFAPLVNFWGLEGLFFLIGAAYALTVVMLLMMKPLPHRTRRGEGWLWRGLLERVKLCAGSADHSQRESGLGWLVGCSGCPSRRCCPSSPTRFCRAMSIAMACCCWPLVWVGLTGTVTLAWIGNLRNSASIQLVAGVGLGLGLTAFSRITWFPAAVGVMGLVGGFSVMFLTINNTLVQSSGGRGVSRPGDEPAPACLGGDRCWGTADGVSSTGGGRALCPNARWTGHRNGHRHDIPLDTAEPGDGASGPRALNSRKDPRRRVATERPVERRYHSAQGGDRVALKMVAAYNESDQRM